MLAAKPCKRPRWRWKDGDQPGAAGRRIREAGVAASCASTVAEVDTVAGKRVGLAELGSVEKVVAAEFGARALVDGAIGSALGFAAVEPEVGTTGRGSTFALLDRRLNDSIPTREYAAAVLTSTDRVVALAQ